MQRLYKFFFLLYLALFAVSLLYGAIMSWATYTVMQASVSDGISIGSIPFFNFIRLGFVQAICYSLFLFLIIISLFRRSFAYQQRFTIKHIITITWLFFAVTTTIFVIHMFAFSNSFSISILFLLAGPQLSFPLTLWFPFLLAWLVLFVILASRIKKAE